MKSRARSAWLGIAFLTAIIFFSGCATQKGKIVNTTSALLQGMVYNESRNPVLDMSVSLVGEDETKPKTTALTDIHGRYAFPSIPYGPVTLEFKKEGYEPLTWSFSFTHPDQVVYVQMTNLDELLDDSADDIQKKDWSLASATLDRIAKINPDNRVAVYLRAELLSGEGKPAEAASLLEDLSSKSGASFAVELSLADLYQDKLDQPDKALVHLRKALAIQGDVDVENRIAELENKK